MAEKVKFIRVRGRVVPIKDKSAQKTQANKKAKILNRLAKTDRKIAETGKTMGKAFAATGIAGAGVAVFSKRFKVVGASLSVLGGLGALTSFGAASGRKMSARSQEKNAKRLRQGLKVKKYGFGAASERAFSNAKFLEKASKKQTDYFYKKVKK